jgi:hypothetical protein
MQLAIKNPTVCHPELVEGQNNFIKPALAIRRVFLCGFVKFLISVLYNFYFYRQIIHLWGGMEKL